MIDANGQANISPNYTPAYAKRFTDNMARDNQPTNLGAYTIYRTPNPGLVQGPAGANLDIKA